MSSSRPLVSVITPSFNQARFLEATMVSVLDQEHSDLEYIVIDGGSTDGSVDLIRKYAAKLAYWVSEPDSGQSDAINKGWRRARGEVLAYLNSDDQYTPGAVAAALEFLGRHPEVGIVYGPCYSLLEGGRATHLFSPPEFDLSRLLLENFIPQPTVFLRRAVVDRVGYLDVRLHYCMDYDFWIRAALAGIGIRRLNGPPLAHLRILPSSKTSRSSMTGLREGLDVLERAFSSGQLPVGLLRIKRYAQARRHLAIAYGHCLCGEVVEARRFLWRAVAVSARILRDPQFLLVGASTLLGSRGSRLARRIRWKASRRFGPAVKGFGERGGRNGTSAGREAQSRP